MGIEASYREALLRGLQLVYNKKYLKSANL